MKYKVNWEATQKKWKSYWQQENKGRPLMCVIAEKEDKRDPEREAQLRAIDMIDKYRTADRLVERFRYFAETHDYLAESFPNFSLDFGPGSMAGYLGSEIKFNEDTVWFEHFVTDWTNYPELTFNAENKWFAEHIKLFFDVKELIGDDFLIGIPDIMENMDVLSSLRGVQELIFDMIDMPEEIQRRLDQIQSIYYEFYDRFYDIVKDQNGGSCYTVFNIWGPGRTAKLQCDYSALISPDNFRDFVQEELRQQAKKLDSVLYHLDGPDAIKHMDALMEIDEIDALQWTSGDHGPDGTIEEWYPIYDKAIVAGKSIWVKVYTGEFHEWLERLDRMVKRYGSNAMFLKFPIMSQTQATELLAHADKYWCDVKGEIQPHKN